MSTGDARFEPLLAQLRQRLLGRAMLYALAIGVLVAGAARLIDGLPAMALGIAAGLLALLLHRLFVQAWRLGAAGLATHLDRRFGELEESSALLLQDSRRLEVVQRLQRARVEAQWARVLEEPERWLPPKRLAGPALLAGLGLTLHFAAVLAPPGSTAGDVATEGDLAGAPASSLDGPASAETDAALQLSSVTVEPPAYTQRPAYTVTDYDIELPEGALLTWRFAPRSGPPLSLRIGDPQAGEQQVDFEKDDSSGLLVRAVVERTALYRIEQRSAAGVVALPGIHTLTVTLDQAPRLRVLEPRQSRVDIPRAGPATLSYRVSIDDDYGVDSVWILASVAKGSGEGVKFRDERFSFDRVDPDGESDRGGRIYERRWSLAELGMEPGDEVYLFTVARDGHPGTPNEGRSDTLVIRWLDEAVVEEATAGLAISVTPEYFKSQRQIIMETEQLIADRDRLSSKVFEDTARALGQSQADLKERYGQYLGDESGEGESPFGRATGEAAREGEVDREDGGEDEHDHDHNEGRGPDTAGSAAQLIERFAHDHGTADIGPITRRNPVGLMKRSVANMWQAELQLRLAEPEAALSFEYEALRYFDLARQAERIYTRRLGFEPPPVSEERRLSGELDDIQSQSRHSASQPDLASEILLSNLHRFLNSTAPDAALQPEQRELLQRAARFFMARVPQRPELIRVAADLERLRVAGRFALPDCDECPDALRAATWSLLPPVRPAPDTGGRIQLDELGLDYLERLDRFSAVRRFGNTTTGSDTP